jgi:dienelactone hydrolase
MRRPLLILAALWLGACTSLPSYTERRTHADALAQAKGWQGSVIPGEPFSLVTYTPKQIVPVDTLTIYIEGDGLSWVTMSQASADPTPRNPIALRMALAHPEGNAAYLGRPCQYVDAETTGCARRYWTDARFSAEVIDAASKAVDVLKSRFGATRLNLVGYSGGAAVATLLVARRDDIDRLVTVAGNLDPLDWTSHHRVSPLSGSLTPVAVVAKLDGRRQWHFVGSKDTIIPPTMVQRFALRFPAENRPNVLIEPQFDHVCCWAETWASRWNTLVGGPEQVLGK